MYGQYMLLKGRKLLCGICGFIGPSGKNYERGQTIGLAMAKSIAKRGPDDAGSWVDANVGVVLAHRRLSVVELSQAGHQPMVSSSGRFQIIFNGEIYNHLDLRRRLEETDGRRRWQGGSDTETLLALIESAGFEAALADLVGMFAIALWDKELRRLYLARDRFGEKPLYYGWNNSTFFFSSDLAAVREHPEFVPRISDRSVSHFLKYSYIPSGMSIYDGILKLMPGTFAVLDTSLRADEPGALTHQRYWSVKNVVAEGLKYPLLGNAKNCADALEDVLLQAVKAQMIGDVPIGAFLSGGVDSSAVVALMQSLSSSRIRTFSIGFKDAAYDESVYAESIARHLGTQHKSLIVDKQEVVDILPSLADIYTEPFADSSQIPTALVSRFAREDVTVALSGDGADELFGGYNRYLAGIKVWRATRRLPKFAREVALKVIRSRTTRQWDAIFATMDGLVGRSPSLRMPGMKMQKIADVMHADRVQDFYELVSSTGRDAGAVFERFEEVNHGDQMLAWLLKADGGVEAMMALDTMTYLPDDVLVKVDRASMAFSLEARAPFLDHRVIEMAWRIPQGSKINRNGGKQVLRDVLYRHVPKELIERPKMGFGIPLGSWLRTELRDWAEELLSERALNESGYFNVSRVRDYWRMHLDQQRDQEGLLWNILMFQAWHQRWAVQTG